MFQRWKTTGFTAFLWKTIGGALRGHRSGNRAPAGRHGRATANRPVGAHSRRGAPCFRAGPSFHSQPASTARARAFAPLRAAGDTGRTVAAQTANMAGLGTRPAREDGTADDLRLADQPELCGRDTWGRGRDDEPTRHRVVVQAGPRGLIFFSSRKTSARKRLTEPGFIAFAGSAPNWRKSCRQESVSGADNANVR